MTFISTVFENVYMVKLVRIPESGSALESVGYGGATKWKSSKKKICRDIFKVRHDIEFSLSSVS